MSIKKSLYQGEGVLGCVKVERISKDEAEIGMFSVDPSNQVISPS